MTQAATAPAVVTFRKRERSKPRSRAAHFSPEQLERFLRAAKEFGKREYCMFLFGFAHGARASEICNLRLSDLNLRQGTVHIARLKGSLDSTQALCHVKGNFLFGEEKAFREWLAIRQPDANDFVFNSRKSSQLNRATIFRLFRAICERAGIEDKTLHHPHVLKHTLAMTLVESNTNAFMIRQQLGHKSFDSTLQYVNASDRQASHATARALAETF